MSHRYRIEKLQHYGIPFQNEAELDAAFRFYQHLGFRHVIKDQPGVKWFQVETGNKLSITQKVLFWLLRLTGWSPWTELHIFVDESAPCPKEPNMVHGNFLVDNMDAVWELWQKLWDEGWTDPVTGKNYRMKKKAYKDTKLAGVRDRVHAFDPWNNHVEFWELVVVRKELQ